ncbi:DNA helicase PIF1 [Sugiyamaella lignohabitans]|uniref:ATP-dependent DNA helicase PIF1 n=1 Tax=Sugiyamaella lignohabitans TaxID=796027 RepID=A0A161HKE9_9ASCO|nr:DNA helicase PIF1 [Sugiyamaella lignohabitans]ANB12138.1 DNA helicase PIF1 [Sugiyamaella lignohabitans]
MSKHNNVELPQDDGQFVDSRTGFAISLRDLESSSPISSDIRGVFGNDEFSAKENIENAYDKNGSITHVFEADAASPTRKAPFDLGIHSSDFSSDDVLDLESFAKSELSPVRTNVNTLPKEKSEFPSIYPPRMSRDATSPLKERIQSSPLSKGAILRESRKSQESSVDMFKLELDVGLHHFSQTSKPDTIEIKENIEGSKVISYSIDNNRGPLLSSPTKPSQMPQPPQPSQPLQPLKHEQPLQPLPQQLSQISQPSQPLQPLKNPQFSQISQLHSTPVAWSSSPDYHKTETLATLHAKNAEKRDESTRSTGIVTNENNEPKPVMEIVTIENGTTEYNDTDNLLGPPRAPLSTPAKKQIWNQPVAITRAARAELRKANMQQKRNVSSVREEYVPEEIENAPSIEEPHKRPSRISLPHLKKRKVDKFFLSQEQKQILDMVVHQEHNMFFTGAAGTGKSVLLERIITDLRRKYSPGAVAVTASTGLAACHIGGVTLHNFSGIGLGREDVDTLVKKIRRNRKCFKRWKETRVLVIDEISMIDGDLFDKLEQIARRLRTGADKHKPFGGIQVVITGDFFQLPPVPDRKTSGEQKEFKFCFEAEYWPEVITQNYVLKQVFRQKDNTFSTMLNEMRRGDMSDHTIRTFESLSRPLKDIPAGLTPTELFPMRHQVERANRSRSDLLSGISHIFEATDKQKEPSMEHVFNLNNLMAVEKLELKIGSQVMMIKNVDETLVNGSLGTVIGFMDDHHFMLYGENKGIDLSTQEIRDAHAGKLDLKGDTPPPTTATTNEFDDDDVFGIPSDEEVERDSLSVNWKRKKAKLRLLQYTDPSTGKQSGKLWPLVRFKLTDGTTRDVLVQEETWTLENQEGIVMASRAQVPLILAWALSIHKAQGQTLEYVKIDLRKAFEKGQAYVAISRATRLDGLQVSGFSRDKVMVHRKVVDFYDSLASLSNEENDDNFANQTTTTHDPEPTTTTKHKRSLLKQDYTYVPPKQQLRFDDFKPQPTPEVITRVGSANAASRSSRI